jgi:hypothetical protein
MEAVTLCKFLEEEKWKKAYFMVFDTVVQQPYEERVERMQEISKEFPSWVKLVDVVKCTGKKKMRKLFLTFRT